LGIAKWRMVVNAAGAELDFRDERAMLSGRTVGTLFLPSIVGGDVIRLAVGLRRSPRPARYWQATRWTISGRDGADGTGAAGNWAAAWFDAGEPAGQRARRCSYLLPASFAGAMTILLHRCCGWPVIRFRGDWRDSGTRFAAFRASLMYCCSGGSLDFSSRRRF